jgi:hypothetical protein
MRIGIGFENFENTGKEDGAQKIARRNYLE